MPTANPALIPILALGTLLAACSAAASPPKGPAATARPGPGGSRPCGASPAGTPLLPVEGVACAALGCVYHAGARAYFACTSAAAGTCFHFGGPCTPVEACQFDPGDGRYKQCDAVVEGACTRWGAACAPASGCLYDPRDGLHHRCEQVTDGKCARRGALCTP
jgi:hypothetical protein